MELDLCQKVCVINDFLVVSWAGSYIAARSLLVVRLTAIDAGQATGNALDRYSDQPEREITIRNWPTDGLGY